MNTVEPIRDIRKLNKMKAYMRTKGLRNYALFVLGINSALRAEDLLTLSVGDIFENGKVKKQIMIQEGKTRKAKSFPLSKSVRDALTEYFATVDLNETDPLFPSRKKRAGQLRPITRQQWDELIKQAAAYAKIKDPISTHSLRKTWAYHAYKRGESLATVMKCLNHTSIASTMRYIGITQDVINDAYLRNSL